MKKLIQFLFLLAFPMLGNAQSMYMTRSGQISFYSKTPMENIEAVNNEVTSLLNTGTGEVAFAVLIKSFHFDRALMEEHFNENYMESTKFPKGTFQGKIMNLSAVDFAKDGTYGVEAEGNLTIHGVKQPVKAPGTLVIAKGKISLTANFVIQVEDYKIEIPSLVSEKIAKSLAVKVNCTYEPKS